MTYKTARELFENEWFPKANAIGVSWQEFWGMNPRIIKLLFKGHEEKIREQDYLAWLFGQYTLSAVLVAVEHCLAGHKAKAKYMEKPILQEADANKQLTEEEKQREVDLFFAKEKVRRINWRRHRQKQE